jgi:hypothetical protein
MQKGAVTTAPFLVVAFLVVIPEKNPRGAPSMPQYYRGMGGKYSLPQRLRSCLFLSSCHPGELP